MLWEVDVWFKDRGDDHGARSFALAAAAIDPADWSAARTVRGWLIEGDLSRDDVVRLAEGVLIDPVSQTYAIRSMSDPQDTPFAELSTAVHVLPKAGVTDPAAETARQAFRLLGLVPQAVRSLSTVWLPSVADERAERLAWRILASDAIHEVVVGRLVLESIAGGRNWTFSQTSVSLEGLDDAGLAQLSRERCLALSPAELRAIRDHFHSVGRDPWEIELETIAQTWSEHCCHKTLTSGVDHVGPDGAVHYDNLLKETVFAATQTVRANLGAADWCVSVFRDNSGVVRFDGDHDICVKVETHNHPSAIEPYGGAATGLGGVIRDVLGTGRAAKPIANLDVFCVGPPDTKPSELPPGVIEPRRLLSGVVAGVRDYGNRMGIPTIAGAVAFEPGYLGNPLVFCGTVGIMPRNSAETSPQAGDFVVVAGGRTGRDGIHGATFSSIELSSDSETESGGSVQIGHAINEKTLTDFVLEAARQRLFTAITDCGAGGLSSAVGEMGATLGAEVDLDQVPLKYDGLSATEVWISEAQERMVMSVPAECWERLSAVAEAEQVEATVIGRFTGDGRLVLRWQGVTAGDLNCHFLHEGRPRTTLIGRWTAPASQPLVVNVGDAESNPFAQPMVGLLALPDVASKEGIIRQYDHEVQGCSVLKPLTGRGDGPADGTVVRGVLGRDRGVVLAVGLRHRLGRVAPYQMAAGGILEAIANVVATGANPSQVALLDNFCWGDTRSEEGLGSLVEACRACQDVAVALSAPFVSGKDSLNNVFAWKDATGQQQELSIPPTLLATAMGQIDDVNSVLSPAFRAAGNRLYVVGLTRPDMIGSQAELLGLTSGGGMPEVDTAQAGTIFQAIHAAAKAGLIRACHDVSDGGLMIAVAEMAIAGGLGCRFALERVPAEIEASLGLSGVARDLVLATSESPARFVCEVAETDAAAFEATMAGVPHAWCGETCDVDPRIGQASIAIIGVAGEQRAAVPLAAAAAAWRSLECG
jgi:phosphoribosylformylglycinamidine synthase II